MAKSGPARIRRRRWPRRLGILAVFFAAAALVVSHYLQPAQLTALILSRASNSLNLDLRTTGPGGYAWRPEPRLVLPGLSATVPGDRAPFFRSEKIELALPWDTLRGRGAEISRIVLESPDIDLAGLRRWQATQPPSSAPLKLPALTRGLSVINATIRGQNWTADHVDLAVPSLGDGKPMTIDLRGDLVRSTTSHFALHAIAANAAGVGQGLRLDGLRLSVNAEGDLPSLTAAGHVLASSILDIDMHGSLQRVPEAWATRSDSSFSQPGGVPFAIALVHKPPPTVAGIPVADARSGWRLQISLGDPERQPSLSLQAQENGEALIDAGVSARLSRWPDAWPRLPSTLANDAAPLVFRAGYHGPVIPPQPFSFSVRRGDIVLQGTAEIADLRAWARGDFASLVPPVQGSLDAPLLELGGVRFHGVHAEVHDDTPPQPPAGLGVLLKP